MKTILRLFPRVKSGFYENVFTNGSKDQFEMDIDEYTRLFDGIQSDRRRNILYTPKAEIFYIGDFLDSPWKVQGFRADRIEIYGNMHIPDEILYGVLATITEEIVRV